MSRVGEIPRLRFTVLGSVDLSFEESTQRLDSVLRHTRAVGVLAYLVLDEPFGPKHRDHVALRFWPDVSQEKARHALRQMVYLLRQHVHPDIVLSKGLHEIVVQSDLVRCDALEFKDAVRRTDVERASELYRGRLLDGLIVTGCPLFEDWVESQRVEYARLARTMLMAAAENATRTGHVSRALDLVRRCLDADPYDEVAVRALIELHGGRGDSVAAAVEYRRFSERLAADLELAPSQETQAIAARHSLGPPTTAGASVSLSPISRDLPPVAEGRTVAPWWRTRLITAVAVSVVAIAVLSIRGLLPSERVDSPAVAVLPFTVHDSSRLALREGLMDLIAIRLNSVPGVGAVNAPSVLQAMDSTVSVLDSESLLRIADRVHANRLVVGRVVAQGEGIRVVTQLFAAGDSLELLHEAEVAGADAELLDIVDGLVAELLTNSRVPPQERNRLLASATSRSPDAVTHFLEGERRFRSASSYPMLMADRFAEAETSYRLAFELDSTFALAAYRLAQVRSLRGDHTGAVEWSNTAQRVSDRLPPHFRTLIRANHAYETGWFADAETLYRSVLEGRPNEIDALAGLAETMLHGNPLRGRAIDGVDTLFAKAVELDVNRVELLGHLAHLRYAVGDFEHGVMWALRARGNGAVPHVVLGQIARTPDINLATLVRHASPIETLVASFMVAGYLGDLTTSGELAEIAIDGGLADPWREEGKIWSGVLEAARGHYRTALAILADDEITGDRVDLAGWLASLSWFIPSLVTSSDLPRVLQSLDEDPPYLGAFGPRMHRQSRSVIRAYLRGVFYGEAGRVEESDSIALFLANHSSESEGQDSLARDLSRALRAREAWKGQGRLWDALDILDQVNGLTITYQSGSPFYSRADIRLMRAEILRALGRTEEALRWYETFDDRQEPLLDLAYRAFIDSRLGEIYLERGDKDQARWHYERMLKHWVDPDPELLPIKAEAEARLREIGQ